MNEAVGFPLGERNGGNNADFFFTDLSKIEISHILMLSKKTAPSTITTSIIIAYIGVTTTIITATSKNKEKIRRREKRKRKMMRYFMNRVCGVYGTISIFKIALHYSFEMTGSKCII